MIVTDRVPTSVPGAGRYRFVATRDAEGRYAMVYAPVGRPFTVRMTAITGARVKAWWFNPRDGKATPIGEFANEGEREFTPPDPGEIARLGARARRRGAGLPAARRPAAASGRGASRPCRRRAFRCASTWSFAA